MHVGAVRFGRVWSHRCGSRVCRVLAPATCEPFIASVLWFFPSGLVLLLLALLAGCHLEDQVLLRAAKG